MVKNFCKNLERSTVLFKCSRFCYLPRNHPGNSIGAISTTRFRFWTGLYVQIHPLQYFLSGNILTRAMSCPGIISVRRTVRLYWIPGELRKISIKHKSLGPCHPIMARDRSGPGRRIIGIVERKEGRNRWKTIGANNTKQITFDIQLTVIIEPQLRPIVARFPSCFSPISWQHGGAPPPNFLLLSLDTFGLTSYFRKKRCMIFESIVLAKEKGKFKKKRKFHLILKL